MADSRFFKVARAFTLAELEALTGAKLVQADAASKVVKNVAPLQTAWSDDLSFLDNKKYLSAFKVTKAGACFVKPALAEFAPLGTACLVSDNPYKAYALAATAFYPEPPAQEFRAPTAFIHPTAQLGKNCFVSHGVYIGENVKIGEGCRILPNAVIQDGVEVGTNTEIGATVVLSHCTIGSRVRILPGACIGQPGFGFAIDKGVFLAVPQLGRVIVEDDCEIGANTTIDRGAGPDTVVGKGTRIDNLVQLGHNVKLGRNCVIVAQTGISGSTQLGDFVMTGGQSGFAGHLNVGSGAKIAAQSGVMRDVPPQTEYIGSPAVPMKQFMRQIVLVSKLAKARLTGKGDDE